MKRYNPKEVEPKWQKVWDETGVYTTDLQSSKPKYLAMSMFNYPSGILHIGHAMNYTISDVKARFKRQQGFESYHPVGWDAFGLPAENRAIKAGVSPQESMAELIPLYHKMYKAMGWSNDWEKEIATHLPEYYKWTQWIFSEMYRNGLAYQDSRMQWWCTIDNTVLANEQVIDGKCWRHDGPNDPPAEKREVKQWFFKITNYADELLDAIDGLDWTESVKLAQKNWIGKKSGVEITYKVDNASEPREITCFTTRPDTNFGATFVVISPEHELAAVVADGSLRANDGVDRSKDVAKYIKAATAKTEVERQQEGRKKTGVFTGLYAVNTLNNKRLPIWVADFVLAGFGTGAVVGVPAHDERDYEFAKAFNLPIEYVVAPEFTDTETPPRQGVEFVERVAAQAIVKHPTDDTYLTLRLKGWDKELYGYPTGGLDEGEDAVAAATRELREETGLHNIAGVRQVGEPYYARFYHEYKKVNRRVKMYTVAIELKDLDRVAVADEEQAIHELHWMTADEVAQKVHGEGCKRMFEVYRTGDMGFVDEDGGIIINSDFLDGLNIHDATEKIMDYMEAKGWGKRVINYRMRDWSVSRQRYWGAPIPIVYCPKDGPVLVPDEQLPVVLPELEDFAPSGDGRSALARATDWLKVKCPTCGGDAERETDTLDTYICSSWYMYRYMDPHNQRQPFDPELVQKWEPVDFYNGADHATAHLLYARFIGHFFKRLGLVNEPEPFKQFLFNGKVTAQNGEMFSKSKGNGVDPLEIINQGYGADALRTYLMFAAPLEIWARWDPQGVPGTHRFLSRVWNLVGEYGEARPADLSEAQQKTIRRATHAMIRKITEDIEANRYNTAIAAAMACTNELYKLKTEAFGTHEVWLEALEALVACTAPFAPHISEELWFQLGHSTSIHRDTWPKWNEEYLVKDTVTVAVQVNGKLRGTVDAPVDADEAKAVNLAEADPKIAGYLDGKQVVKTIYVPAKLLNFVVK